MQTNGAVLGPSREPFRVETESSGLRCVRLFEAGAHVQFVAITPANALVVRYSLPDSPSGGGIRSHLGLYVNGRRVRTLDLDSGYNWLYGNYPFSNRPADGKPRNFYDEVRVQDLTIRAGDLVRLQWESKDAADCILDLVDTEEVAPPLTRPAGSISIADYGAQPGNGNDATEPLRRCIAAVAAQGGVVWAPPGEYRITGDILLPSHVTIQGAGMWHTRFVGDPALYGRADRRVRFKLTGSEIVLADFSIQGRLNYRNDQEPNDGVVGAGCANCAIRRVWIEHTKVGIWVYNGANLRIEGCRFRNTLADGVNLCVGTYGTVVEDCSARGTGDDCFAIWPAASDQDFVSQAKPGNNVIRHCTGQLPFLANGAAVYGGHSNRIEQCAFTDITAGCGILISSTFPTADPATGVDNNFSGITAISGCELLRCGGWDHAWGYRGSVQICLDRRSISGLRIDRLSIIDSLSDGITVVGPGSRSGQGTLADAELRSSRVQWTARSQPYRSLWIRADAAGGLTLVNDAIPSVTNESGQFKIAGP